MTEAFRNAGLILSGFEASATTISAELGRTLRARPTSRVELDFEQLKHLKHLQHRIQHAYPFGFT